MTRLLVAAFVLALWSAGAILSGGMLRSGEALAIDARGQYDVFGSGSVRCNQWTRSRKLRDSTSDRDAQWVAGYVTAYNRWVHDEKSIVPSTDPEALYAMVDKFCQVNPLDSLSGATESVILDLKSR